jgi:hypothetical protein
MSTDPRVRDLLAALTAARLVYEKDVRSGAALALGAVFDFLDQTHVDPGLLTPLRGLHGALADAMAGIRNEHLELTKHRGGTKTPVEEAYAWGHAAATVTLLREAGAGLSDALSRVAKVMGQDSSPAKLKNFRKRLTRGDTDVRTEAKEHYDFVIRESKAQHAASPKLRAEAALATLQMMLTRKGAPATGETHPV